MREVINSVTHVPVDREMDGWMEKKDEQLSNADMHCRINVAET